MREIYDIITKRTFTIQDGGIRAWCRSIKTKHRTNREIDRGLHILGRYISPNNKDKIFTLIDFDTAQEYDCICNTTLEYYFNKKMTMNEIKYVFELKRKRQNLASILGRVFYLKGSPPKKTPFKAMKNMSPQYKSNFIQQKYKTKLQSKIYHALLSRINYSIKNKTKSSKELTGCNVSFLMGYLEKQFAKEMTWSNYGNGGWHIDHIKPCDLFNLEDEKQKMECFHYSNLQPLWSTTKIAMQHGQDETYIGNLDKNAKNIKGGVALPVVVVAEETVSTEELL